MIHLTQAVDFKQYFYRRSKMKYVTTTGSPPGFIALMVGAMLLGLVSQGALAVNTTSGTSISNQADLTFSVGAVVQPTVSATTTFKVDDKVNVLVAGGVITNVSPNQTGVATPFTVSNNGNATQGYTLAAANATSGGYTVNATAITDDFDPATALRICLDDGSGGGVANDGILQAGELAACPAAPGVTTIATLAPGASVHLLVVTDTPGTGVGSANNDAAVVSLKATTLWPTPLVPAEENGTTPPTAGAVVTATAGADTADVDVVLADPAGSTTSGLASDVLSDGVSSNYGAFKVVSAVLSITKVATVICDPINGNGTPTGIPPKNIPGAYVQYAITITNALGAAQATLTQVTDTLVAQLAADNLLISGAGAVPATACSAGGTSLSASGFGAVYGTGTTVTTYAAPGLAGQAVTAGAAIAGQNITITYGSLTGGGLGAFAGSGGALPANSFITVYFNAIVQ
jgi:hypothetical protein